MAASGAQYPASTPQAGSRRTEGSGSDVASSPSLTLSSAASTSSTRAPSTPRTPARYPTSLSVRTQTRPSKSNVSPSSGKPYEYQSLEDLLQANGYKETRIFTPDSDRLKATKAQAEAHDGSPTPPRQAPEGSGRSLTQASTTSAATGGVVASLLSSWIPGGPRSTSRMEGLDPETKETFSGNEGKMPAARGSPLLPSPDLGAKRPAETAGRSQERGSRVPRTALTDALESALRKAQQPQGPPTQQASTHSSAATHILQRKARGASPASTLTPSSSSSTIRPSSRQRIHQQSYATQVTDEETPPIGRSPMLAPPEDIRIPLRHHASAPTVGRSKSNSGHLHTVRPHRRPLASKGEPWNPTESETWFGTFSRVFSHVSAISRESLVSDNTATPGASGLQRSSSTKSQRSKSQKSPGVVVTQHFSPAPATAAVSAVQSDAVLCRSAPASRSTSRVRGGTGQKRGRTPAGVGKGGRGENAHVETPLLSPSLESSGSDPMSSVWIEDLNRADDIHSSHTEDDDDTDPPNLQDLLSSHLKRHARASGNNRHSFASTSGSESDEPITRRQRSIRSLRAHLSQPSSSTVIPGLNGIPALPALPFNFKPKPLTVRSATMGNPSATTDFEAWLNGTEGNAKREQLNKQKKRGLLPQWLSPKDGGVEQLGHSFDSHDD